MLKPITEKQQQMISSIMEQMTLEEKACQVQCVNASNATDEVLERLVDKWKVGSFFVGNQTKERYKEVFDKSRRDNGIPIIINADLVNGAGARMDGATLFPHQMGIASSENAVENFRKVGELTAEEGRAYGVQWTLAPVSDLCLNKDNPMMHVRTSGDSVEHVKNTVLAFIDGTQKESYMAACAKHFPGDGVDQRDTHVSTLVNSLSRDEWMNSYGRIWKSAIEAGVMTIMGGHIALPWIDPEYEDPKERYKGLRPATLSKKIQLEFLRGELGFDGLIVSDAINMVGFGSHLKREDYGWKLVEAGSDVLLWTIPEIDTPSIINAIKDGRLSQERLDDAVRRVLELKARLGVLDGSVIDPTIEAIDVEANFAFAQHVADTSITIIRDEFNVLPLTQLKPGSRVCTITFQYVEGKRHRRDSDDMHFLDDELRNRGFEVDHIVNPKGLNKAFREKMESDYYDVIFCNIKYPPRYGSIRLYGDSFEGFKGSWWVENPRVVVTAFGDPYKIFDLPSLHSYINAYSNYEPVQRAIVKVWLGEQEAVGKSPIEFPGMIERGV